MSVSLIGLLWASTALAQSPPESGPAVPTATPPTATDAKDSATKEKDVDKEDSKATVDNSDAGEMFFARPAALAALGSTSSKLDEPGTLQDFAVTAGNFFTPEGLPAPGGAVEVGARALGLTRRVTADQYRGSYGLRTLSHSYLSLATTKRAVADGDDDVLMASGLRVVLLHGGDPLLERHYLDAINATEQQCTERAAAAADPLAFDPVLCRKTVYNALAKDLPTPAWNSPGVVVSGALVSSWLGGAYSGFTPEQAAGWVSGTLGLQKWGQLGMGLSWTQSLTDAPHEFSPSLRLRAGFGKVRVSTEGAYVLGVGTAASTHSGRVLLGGEFQVAKGSWFTTEFGLQLDPAQDLVTLLTGASFRWGRASQPGFKPLEEDKDEDKTAARRSPGATRG